MKKLTAILICFLLLSNSFLVEAKSSKKIQVGSKAAMLVDLNTGKVLFQKDAHEKLGPASMTKILTAIIILERCKLNKVVTVKKDATLQPPSKIYLKNGEKITVNNLLYAMMLNSANDAAYALAEYAGGSVKNFAKMMNKKAKSIGCKDSNFVNPNGLYDKHHYTSAHDMALISKYAMKITKFRQIVDTKNYKIPSTNKSKARSLVNHNKMLLKSTYYYPGCTGIKTGYTIKSQHTLAVSCTKGKKKLLAVLLDNKVLCYKDAATLFNYGFGLIK